MIQVNDIVIVSGVCIVIGMFNGSFKYIYQYDFGVVVICEVIVCVGIVLQDIDEMIVGNVG